MLDLAQTIEALLRVAELNDYGQSENSEYLRGQIELICDISDISVNNDRDETRQFIENMLSLINKEEEN